MSEEERIQLQNDLDNANSKVSELSNRIIDALIILMEIDYEDKNEWIPPKKIEPVLEILSGVKKTEKEFVTNNHRFVRDETGLSVFPIKED